MIDNIIIYEQPLNELIRVCLRVEQLFEQLDYYSRDSSPLSTRNQINLIINLLQVLDRPDLKAKLAKELTHQMEVLLRLETTPDVDGEKLQILLKDLEELARCFIDSNGKIAQNIRDVELLNSLRLHLASPGGACSFDIPNYHYWLHQPTKIRYNILQEWTVELKPLRKAITIILRLAREGAKTQQKTADHGFYQELLDAQTNLRLVRVMLATDIPAYPEISAGRHFLGVRFFSPSIQDRPTQYQHHLQFWIAHCAN